MRIARVPVRVGLAKRAFVHRRGEATARGLARRTAMLMQMRAPGARRARLDGRAHAFETWNALTAYHLR